MAAYSTNVSLFTSDQVSLRISGACFVTNSFGINYHVFKFAEERYLSEGTLLVQGGKPGDFLDLSVVDVDNILGAGANFVARTFVENFQVNSDETFQTTYKVPYIAKLPPYLYLRIAYTAVDNLPRRVMLNLLTHIPT